MSGPTSGPEGPESPEDTVRTQGFTTDGPIDIDVHIGTGRLEIELTDDSGEGTVQVDVRHDPASGLPWTQGLTSALSWVHEQFGDQFDLELAGTGSAAVEQTRIEMQGSRLTVRPPKGLPLRHLPLAITVRAPSGSRLDVRAASAQTSVAGIADRATITSTSGDVGVGQTGPLHVRTGGGEVQVDRVTGGGTIATGTGSVRVGAVEIGNDEDLTVRSGSGDVSVTDAAEGAIRVRSGAGNVRVGLRTGVLAEVDLSSATGKVASELDVSTEPPEATVSVQVKASTGSGDVVVTGGGREQAGGE